MWTLLFACTDDFVPTGPTPTYNPGGEAFFDTPWPSDDRRDDDGTISLQGFPNPFAVSLISTYLERAEALQGFGTSSPVYVGFDGPLDPLAMPTPAESLQPGSSVVLLDIDPRSPFRGERVAVQWQQFAFPDSSYASENLLAVAPVFGWPLRGRTRYALLLTTRAASPSEAWRASPLDPELAELLPELDLEPEDLAIATTFTTQDPVGELADIAWYVQNELGPPVLDNTLQHLVDFTSYSVYRTQYTSPVFTHGEPPYLLEGGNFEFDADGRPLIARWDDMRLAVCVPNGVSAPPEGFAVVIQQHGTGGNYRSHCNSDAGLEIGTRLGEKGLIALSIDQPLHGSRPGADTASDLNHFNVLNPDSASANFRQGAIDAIYLARALARQPLELRTDDGRTFRTDPERVYFLGHSQGGLTGALAAPFFAGDVKATMLSAVGGVLAITIVERTDPLDFAALVKQLLQLPEEELLTPLHPTLGLVQTLVEITDPVNYAPYWFSEAGHWTNHRPTAVLTTSGTRDAATPYRTAVAVAAAARLPLVGDPASSIDVLRMRSGDPMPLPARDTVPAFDGTELTSGFAQFLDGTHWVVFEEPDASSLVFRWLESMAQGRPVLEVEEL
jgi:hypothetical protein